MTRVVVKLGGASPRDCGRAALDLARGGHEVVVVHGAGPQITAEMERRGIPLRFVAGRRVTKPAALAVVRESLVAVGAELCAALGPAALGLVGDEIGLARHAGAGARARRRPAPVSPGGGRATHSPPGASRSSRRSPSGR